MGFTIAGMIANFVAYVKRDIPSPSRESSPAIVLPIGMFGKPEYHAAGSKVLSKAIEAKREVVLWTFSRIRVGKRRMPAAVDSRMILTSWVDPRSESLTEHVRQLIGKYKNVYRADPSRSEYFPWRDAMAILTETVPKSLASRKVVPELYFQGGGNVTPATAALIESHANSVANSPKAFLSYKWQDGTKQAMDITTRLDQLGIAAWLDMWGMPRSVRERRADMVVDHLWGYLKETANGCDYAILIRTPSYGTGGTRREREILIELCENPPPKLLEITQTDDLALSELSLVRNQ